MDELFKLVGPVVEYLKRGRAAFVPIAAVLAVVAGAVLAVPNREVEGQMPPAYRFWAWIALYTAAAILLVCAAGYVVERWKARRDLDELIDGLTPEELGVALLFVDAGRTVLELPADALPVRLLRSRLILYATLPFDIEGGTNHYELRADVLKRLRRRFPGTAGGHK